MFVNTERLEWKDKASIHNTYLARYCLKRILILAQLQDSQPFVDITLLPILHFALHLVAQDKRKKSRHISVAE